MRCRIQGGVLLLGIVMLAVGCGKKEEPTEPDAAPEMEENGGGMPLDSERAGGMTESRMAVDGETADKMVEDAKTQMAEITGKLEQVAADSGSAQFDAAVDKIHTLIDTEKYQSALTQIKDAMELPNLTEVQQKLLEQLMEKVKKAIADTSLGSAGEQAEGLLKGFGK